jgi:hypothetical protein
MYVAFCGKDDNLDANTRIIGGIRRDCWYVAFVWAYPGLVDRLILGSGGESRLTVFELHG